MRLYLFNIKLLFFWFHSCSIIGLTLTQECLSSSTMTTTDSSTLVCEEASLSCSQRAQTGQCHSNQDYMFLHCPMDCLKDDQLGAIVYYDSSTYHEDNSTASSSLDEKRIKSDSLSSSSSSSCQDLLLDCHEYAEQGECRTNDVFRMEKCPKTCRHCFQEGTTALTIGMGQTIPQESKHDAQQILQFLDTIQSTAKYMSEIVMVQDQYSSVRYECYNYDEHCAALASQGACRQPVMDDDSRNEDGFDHDEGEEAAAAIASQWELYNFMMMQCAPSCHACENMFPTDDETVIQECTPDYSMDIFDHHGMHEMFQRIIGEIPFEDGTIVPDYKVQVLSRPIKPQHDKPDVDVHSLDYHVGPWIIILDDFLTNEECDRLIELGSIEGYKRSELEEEWHKDEEEIRKERESEDAYRTSTNSWCMEECYRDPIAKRVMQKIENVTGVPESHSEYLQLLRYVPGQYYKEHHDYIDGQQYQNPGPRILTFYLYLNDVEEGGGTRFTDIYGDDTAVHIDVQPKKGRALVWPSVLTENPHERDDRTYHEALAVEKGSKFGANAWLHLRPYKNDPCDYDRFYELTEHDSEDDDEEENYDDDDDE